MPLVPLPLVPRRPRARVRPTVPAWIGAASIGLLASCASPPPVPRASELVHAPDDARVVTFPWGWIHWRVDSRSDPDTEMTFGIVQLDAGQANPVHLHAMCEEHLYVLSGSCEHRIGDEWVRLEAGDVIRIPAGVEHAARTTEEPMRAVIVYDAGTRDITLVSDAAD